MQGPLNIACLAAVLAWPNVSVAEDLLRQEMQGGWKGGEVAIACQGSGQSVTGGIRNAQAHVFHNGKAVKPLEVTYLPWGFVMTGGTAKQGATFRVVLSSANGGPGLAFTPYGPAYYDISPIGIGPRTELKCRWAKWQ